ncbi:MAG: efflux RND transporter permease subunit [Phycisphaerae bacterium]|nr:efflux RND transporter permease subunit [Phycisphaerae bacterium]
MDIIRWSIARPVTVSVGVILVVVFGLIGLGRIPIQLTPTVDRPVITVSTVWPGRSPEEVVDSITREQEKRLKNVTNLKTMRSISREGEAEVTLEFYIGTDLRRGLQEVSDQLRQVPDYPDEVTEPTIKTAEGSAETAIAWIIIDMDPAKRHLAPDFDITTIYDAMDREVKPFMERVDGVAEVNIYGGRVKEVQVLLDPVLLAQRGISHHDVIRALRAENRNVSAGSIAEGKRDYRVRVLGQYTRAEEVLDAIVAYRDGRPVYVRDVGTAEVGYEKARTFVRSLGVPCLAMNVIRQSGANVMEVMQGVRGRIEEIRRDILPRIDPVAGPALRIRQVYDETVYIQSAIDLVLNNLREGGVLCIIVLLLFLRSFRSTLVISLAIPVSVIGTFLVMLAAGRTLNVVSLAGLAFSTGVVVDNAVVVLENIDRRRTLGDPPLRAVYLGAKEVWGAILAGTLCHVAVFAPILTLQEEAGRLFFDLTLALSVSILLSLIVAITVVPSAQAVLARMTGGRQKPRRKHGLGQLFGLAPLLDRGVRGFSRIVLWMMTGWRGWSIRPAVIVLMVAASILGARALMPPLDYLPAGNQNLVFGGLAIPPGLSQEQQHAYARRIEERLQPYVDARLDKPETMANLPKVPRFDAPDIRPGPDGKPLMMGFKMYDPVPVENMFIGGFQGGMFVGGTSQDPQRVLPVGALFTSAMNGMPDAFGGAGQASIFGQGLGSGNNINLEISGPSLDRVRAAADFVFMTLMGNPAYGPGAVQTTPGNFNLLQQEWRLRLNRTGRELGLRTEDLGVSLRGLFDGAFAGDFILDGRTVDMKVYPLGGRLEFKERLPDIPIATPSGLVVPLASVADLEPALAPQQIQRIEELPSVTVEIRPPPDKPLEQTMDDIRANVIGAGEKMGLIDPSMRVRLEGSAAKLDQVKASLLGSAPPKDRRRATWQSLLLYVSWGVAAIGLGVAGYAIIRAIRGGRTEFVYAALGALLLAVIVGGLLMGIAVRPDLILARMIWTLMVTYLLMCALFESFLYPFVIMFTVPLGLVGGFAALRIVNAWTLQHPERAPQQLDVLTMLGFVILIGTVVNNAILLVEQARHFMGELRLPGDEDKPPMEPLRAIAESVRTRVRPIFMTTFTTLGGGIPLVIAPGAGAEMYRGLGAVIVGGLFVSTLFTLVLVPLVFSVVMQSWHGLKALLGASGVGTRDDRALGLDEPALQTA